MCGIAGYTGFRQAQPLLMEGLARLEYRGYDSAGVVVQKDGLQIVKAPGKLQRLTEQLKAHPLRGCCGLGHTRWATHGAPDSLNAHPHTNTAGDVAVVHNGVIENCLQLRQALTQQGCRFTSQTDTEVIPHLLGRLYEGDMLQALLAAAPLLEGSYALGVVTAHEPGAIWCMRQNSPLVIGLGEGEQFLASDAPALLPHTRQVIHLTDGQIARLTPQGVTLFDALGNRLPLLPTSIPWDADAAEKGGWPHFMLKEIHEQPEALQRTMAACEEAAFPLSDEEAMTCQSLTITGCGTAFHAGLLGRFYLESLAQLPVRVELASEFRSHHKLLGPETLFLAISQSGETADTLAALKQAQESGAPCLALCNVLGSSLARQAGEGRVMYTRAGPEIAVASTKAYLTQVLTLLLFAVELALKRRKISLEKAAALRRQLTLLPSRCQRLLQQKDQIAAFAGRLGQERIFFMGRGADYAVTLEGALKLKEVSYRLCEAYAAGEMKHGPIALIEPGTLVIAVMTDPALAPKLMTSLREVKTRGARALLICTQSLQKSWAQEADECWPLPDAPEETAPLLAMIPLQLLAYYAALHLGCDVDKPRNLAKSVTVE